MHGIDNSPAMLADATPRARPGLTFELGDIGRWTSDPVHDLVIANASLQWVPDHAEVLARWAAGLAPGGQLAVQVPTNADHPSHWLAAEVATSERFASDFPDGAPADPVAANVLRPEAYAELLHDLGFERQHVRLQVYGHVLPSTSSRGRLGVAVPRSPASGGRCRPSATRSSSASTAIACSPSSVTMRRTSTRSSGS